MIHNWIGQSLLLLIPTGPLKTLSQISNTNLIVECRKHLGRSSNIMIRAAELRNVKLFALTTMQGKLKESK